MSTYTYRLNWVAPPQANTVSQQPQYKERNEVSWTNATPAPLSNTQTMALIPNLFTNVIYDFRVGAECFSTGSTTYSPIHSYILFDCPTSVTLNKTHEQISVSFVWPVGSVNPERFVVMLYNNLTGAEVGSVNLLATERSALFTGLIGNTQYKVRIVPITGTYSKTDCPFSFVTTNETPACANATGLTGEVLT
jgi:hypothetical protein